MKLFLTILLSITCSISSLLGQNGLVESYFSPNYPKFEGNILNVVRDTEVAIIHATTPYRSRISEEYIIATDTAGNMLWNTFKWPLENVQTPKFSGLFASKDGFLYFFSNEVEGQYLYKADMKNGAISWKKLIPYPSSYEPKTIQDRDDNELICTFMLGSNGKRHLTFDRSDGAIVNEGNVPGWTYEKLILNDNQGNLFLVVKDTVVYANGTNLGERIWSTRIDLPYPYNNEYLKYIQKIELSPDGTRLLVFGASNYFDDNPWIICLDATTGVTIKTTRLADWQFSTYFVDLTVRGDTAFCMYNTRMPFSGLTVGGYGIITVKFSDGEIVSMKKYPVIDPGTNLTITTNCSPVDMEMDQQGDLLLLGHLQDLNGEPALTAMKIRLSDMVPLWYKQFGHIKNSLYSPLFENAKIWPILANKGLVMSSAETIWGNPVAAIYGLNLESGQITSKKMLFGVHHEVSKTLSVLTDINGYTLLKQADYCTVVSRYSANHQLNWERTFCGAVYTKAEGFYAAKDSSLLLVTRHQSHPYNIYPYFEYSDSLRIFNLDLLTGSTKKYWSIRKEDNIFYHAALNTDTLLIFWRDNMEFPNKDRMISISSQGTKAYQLPTQFSIGTNKPLPPFVNFGRSVMYHSSGNLYFMNPDGTKKNTPFFGSSYLRYCYRVEDAETFIAGGEGILFRQKRSSTTPVWAKYSFVPYYERAKMRFSDERIFTQGTVNNEIILFCFNGTNGDTIWQQKIIPPNGISVIRDFELDTINNRLLIVGGLRTANDQEHIWIVQLDTAGNILSNSQHDGDIPSPSSYARCVAALPDGSFGIGGQITRVGQDTSGFFWRLSGIMQKASGQVFIDFNNNGLKDGDDYPYIQTVRISPGNFISFPDTSGKYETYVGPIGTFNSDVMSPSPYFNVLPASFTLDSAQAFVEEADIRVVPNATVIEEGVNLAELQPARFGFPSNFLVEIQNLGTIKADSVQVNIECSNPITIELVSVADTSLYLDVTYNSNMATLTLRGTAPLQTQYAWISSRLNTFWPIGDTLFCYTTLETFPNSDANMANNRDTLVLVVVGSYDPNDITPYPSGEVLTSSLGPMGNLDLTYRIRFENTGNLASDFLRVENRMSPLLLPETFRLGATSAPCSVKYLGENRMEFSFPYYQLPPKSQDSLGAQGYIFYQISSRNGLMAGDSIQGSAQIFFDYNPPIYTNIANTYLRTPEMSSSTALAPPLKESFIISPNPASERQPIRLISSFPESEPWYIYDVNGRLCSYGQLKDGIFAPSAGIYQVWCKGSAKWLVVKNP